MFFQEPESEINYINAKEQTKKIIEYGSKAYYDASEGKVWRNVAV